MAEPGEVLVSAKVHQEVERKLPLISSDLGEHAAKNLSTPIHVFRVAMDEGGTQPSHSPLSSETRGMPVPVQPETVHLRPAVAILPFMNMSGDPAQEYFADGITEDLITALAAWRWFPVIARNSTFVYTGRAVDVVQACKDLGARYLLEGSVRRDGDRVRITAQLIEAGNAHHLWAQAYDRRIGDVLPSRTRSRARSSARSSHN
jgi:TolB-like protein